MRERQSRTMDSVGGKMAGTYGSPMPEVNGCDCEGDAIQYNEFAWWREGKRMDRS
jgi:hypothetical protein